MMVVYERMAAPSTGGEIVRAGFERKYLVPEQDADTLLRAVAALLPPDPHGATYSVASLYLDTPDRASYRREIPGKWRLRRYGQGEVVFAEYKARTAPGSVHKRRTAMTLGEEERPGWFACAIQKWALEPTLMVSYERHAFVGVLDGESVRLTLDQELRAAPCHTFAVPGQVEAGKPLTDARILEIKYERRLPSTIEGALTALDLAPESFSKYRAGMDKVFAPRQ